MERTPHILVVDDHREIRELLARYFERFGDHAVGISRRIVYLVTGDHKGERASI